MDKLVVKGGARLTGRVKISGSKNSALPILAATLLTPEKCVLHNVPDLSDIRFMLEILAQLGSEVTFENGTVTTRAPKVKSETPYDLVRKMRASICVLGPIIARCGRATISEPGGCVIGDRPIDIHLKGLAMLGAESRSEGGNVYVTSKELLGCEIFLGTKFGSTVLGTDNVMMCATRAKGKTIIESAACEPEVRDLADVLIKMGAKIVGHGTRRVEIDGVDALGGCEHTIIPDRIEAGTFMVAGLITGGDVFLDGANGDHMINVIDRMKSCGAELKCSGEGIQVAAPRKLSSIDLVTETYPGFPTDMQAQMCALMSVTPGISAITEKIFPSRFMHLSELRRMGAKVDLEGSTAIIHGVPELSGAPVMASDLRASAALVLAGLVAGGTTEVNRVYHIDRGYEHIDQKLRSLGAGDREGAVRRIVYPGTFDPITNGHLDVIGRALQMFDEVVLGIAADSTKRPLFTLEERKALAEGALPPAIAGRVRVVAFQGLLIDFVVAQGSGAILRGLRAVSDFEFEFQMALMNRKLSDQVETIFLMPKDSYTYLSSTIIKEVGRLGGNISPFVPPLVEAALRRKFAGQGEA